MTVDDNCDVLEGRHAAGAQSGAARCSPTFDLAACRTLPCGRHTPWACHHFVRESPGNGVVQDGTLRDGLVERPRENRL